MAKQPDSNLKKFLLLVHKNLLLLWHCKFKLLVELFLPVIFCLLLVPIRLMKIPQEMSATTYNKAFPLGRLDYDKWHYHQVERPFLIIPYNHLAFKPENPCYNSIVKGAADKLGVTHSELAYIDNLTETARIIPISIIFDKSTNCQKNLNYEIKFSSNVITAFYGIPNITWMTNQLYFEFDPVGPRIPNEPDGQIVGYLKEGFLEVQHAISTSFIKLAAKNFKNQALPKVVVQRFPYPKYIYDEVIFQFANVLPLIIMFTYMHPMMLIVWQVSMEREKQLKDVMIMSGLQNWLHWSAWFVRAFVVMGLSALLVTIVLTVKWGEFKCAILNNSSFTGVYFFLLVYIATSITFCFMLATMFSEAIIAVIFMVVIWFITFLPFMPYSILAGNYVNMTLFSKLLWSLIPNTALNFGIHVIMGFEIQGEGLYWSNMFDPLDSAYNSLSMGLILIAMLVSSCIFILISLYLEQIYCVGNFGDNKKWNFPFEKTFWVKKRVTNSESTERESSESFESEPAGRPIGIQLKNLKKSYGDRQVVKGLSMNMYQDQITVLLGHNGDSKTTIISMMTGMILPTSGTIIINGYDINTNLKNARMSLGICPRNDALFDDLTVKEHLIFYSRLRGLKGKSLETEVEKFLKKIGTKNQANFASSLSGGMKRILCFYTALCGGTKVVLCDQSSSGLDPEEKRILWDLLKSERKGRTILLTTNFMDEADMLGDRIAIICDGELKCMGSSLFLKKTFGYGFKLTIGKKPKCHKTADVTTFLNQYIPGLQLIADGGGTLTYHLPSEFSSQLPTILQELENQSNTLAITDYDISMTSLEEVFMKVSTENSSHDSSPTMSGIVTSGGAESLTSSSMFLDNQRLLRGPKLIVSHWQAMFFKKNLSTRRNKYLFATQNLLTICLVALTLLMPLNSNLPPLKMDLTPYRETVTVLRTSSSANTPGSMEQAISANFKAMFESESSRHQLEDIGNKDFIKYMLELGQTQQAKIDTKYIAAASIDKGTITAWLNNEPIHSVPVSLNLIHNAMAKALIGPEAAISVSNSPEKHDDYTDFYFGRYYQNDATSFAINYGFCMSIVTALYALNVIKENQSRAKLLQFSSGVDVLTYWLSHFIWDFTTFMLTALLTIITLALFHFSGGGETALTFVELVESFAIILLFGCAVLPMTYIVAGLFTSPAAGIFFLTIFNTIYGPFIFFILEFMKKANTYSIPQENELKALIDQTEERCLYYPHFALIQALRNLYLNGLCRKCCYTVVNTVVKCYDFEDLCCPMKPYLSLESPGILREVTALLKVTCVSSLFLILTEYISLPRLWNVIRGIFTKLPTKKGHCDESVEQEQLRVANFSKKDIKRQNQNLVIKKLTKFYGSYVAVNQISAGIKHYECFGLLGGDGAGKTTTLKMLTGEEGISSGDAFVKGLSVKWREHATNRKIGYCPKQSYRLFDNLTGCEHLHMYALLRGIPKDKISSTSLELATLTGLIDCYNPVREYSLSNKQKLSITLALLGGPSVIYLDEPTAGMDPASQRNLWNIISKVRDAGTTIVLTTRSMEVCEALCTRLALMVNGEFKYIGSTQYIKSRITKGLILDIKLRKKINITTTHSESDLDIEQKDDDKGSDNDLTATSTQKVVSFIRSKFPCAVLKESNQGYLNFYIPLEKKWWLKIFDINANKDSLDIEDYSISKVTFKNMI